MTRPSWYRKAGETIAEWMERIAPDLDSGRIGKVPTEAIREPVDHEAEQIRAHALGVLL